MKIAKRMLVSGKLTYEDIAAFTDLTLEEIKALAVQKNCITKMALYNTTYLVYGYVVGSFLSYNTRYHSRKTIILHYALFEALTK